MVSPPPRPPPPTDSIAAVAAHTQSPAFNPVAINTPPLPPPKPGAQAHSGPPGPTPLPGSGGAPGTYPAQVQHEQPAPPAPPTIEEGWLPPLLKEQLKPDLESLLASPTLLDSILRSPQTAHASVPASDQHLASALATNAALAQHVNHVASATAAQRADVSSRLLQLRALERQWHLKQAAMDDALAPFSPKALHARLVAGCGEQEQLLRAMEESFVEGEGRAGEREIAEWVKRWREARKTLGLRLERRRRFDEGRVGGWR